MEDRQPLPTVVRLVRLWGIAAYMDALWITRDLKQAVFYFVSETVLSVASVSATLLISIRFGGIGAWTPDRLLFMLAHSTVVMGAMEAFFNFNVLEVSRRIWRGQLDHVLIQPRPLWMALITEGFVPFSGSGSLILGIGMLAWSARRIALPMSPAWIALLLLSVVSSCAIVLAFSYLWGSLAFWSPRGAEEVCSSTYSLLATLRPFPLDGLGPILLSTMLTAAPVGFVGWLPAQVLLNHPGSGMQWMATPIAAVLFCLIVTTIFRKGLREYGRTGSQRYLSHGHRR